jgi:hypothetical protein
MSTSYPIPAMTIWMGVADIVEQNRRHMVRKERAGKNPCPVCGKYAGKRHGTKSRPDCLVCECGAMW